MAQHLLDVGDAGIHVETMGAGLPVVLVHGLGLTSALWNHFADELGDEYRLIRIDLRSAGRSQEVEPGELTLGGWADDLAAVLDELAVDRPVLVGHSLGASIALKYAFDHPDRPRALVLVNADPNLSNLGPRMLTSVERIEQHGLDGWLEKFWSKNPPFSASSLRRDGGILDEYRGILAANDPSSYIRQCRAIAAAEDLDSRLGELTCRVLVLLGGDDDRTLPEQGRALVDAIPGAQLVELPGVGHTIPLEAPGALAAALRSFLAGLDPVRVNGGSKVLRADTTPRNPREGPFGHIDSRWVVGPETGASLVAFGQSTYAHGTTHENHHHPNAEEVVMVVRGRGTQIVGGDVLDVGPGDICFIPRRTPHRITGTSRDEDLVILWVFGGAASLEQAGYVPLPDDVKEVQQ
jgi:pimeloyl-ACP methyl ester carboxylesterase/quercetin dioxygenase-like cupin family protein